MAHAKPVYRRVLLKLSGEALTTADHGFGIEPKVLDRCAADVAALRELGVQVAVVVGGGNFYRGAALTEAGLERVTGDQIAMLATVMNALAVSDIFNKVGIPSRVLSAFAISGVVEAHKPQQACRYMDNGETIIFAAGIGNPYFTTDSAASLRGIEIKADVVLKATKVDGVYSADPVKDKNATLYSELSYQEIIEKQLKVMDLTAVCLCQDNNMPLHVFNMNKSGALLNIVTGKPEGTIIR